MLFLLQQTAMLRKMHTYVIALSSVDKGVFHCEGHAVETVTSFQDTHTDMLRLAVTWGVVNEHLQSWALSRTQFSFQRNKNKMNLEWVLGQSGLKWIMQYITLTIESKMSNMQHQEMDQISSVFYKLQWNTWLLVSMIPLWFQEENIFLERSKYFIWESYDVHEWHRCHLIQNEKTDFPWLRFIWFSGIICHLYVTIMEKIQVGKERFLCGPSWSCEGWLLWFSTPSPPSASDRVVQYYLEDLAFQLTVSDSKIEKMNYLTSRKHQLCSLLNTECSPPTRFTIAIGFQPK